MSVPTAATLAQVALCSADLPASYRFYNHVLGFADAGARIFYGPTIAEIQRLGDDTTLAIWWLVGAQEFFQIELFQHTKPRQRPRPQADLGWVGWDACVPDLAAAYARAEELGLTVAASDDGSFSVVDPGSAVAVSVHDAAALPAALRPQRTRDLRPTMLAATVAVLDLQLAHRLYIETLGLTLLERELLRGSDQVGDGFLACADDRVIEVLRPPGDPRPLPDDHRLSDQGMMNAALGYRSRAAAAAALNRASSAGFPPSAPLSRNGAAYIADGQSNTLELLGVQPERYSELGFTALRAEG